MAFVLSGCGGKHENLCPVAGRVMFQGKPVSSGMIRFSSTQAPIDMLAILGSNGNYEVTRGHGSGLPEGTYRVAIMPPTANRPIGDFGPKNPATQSADIPEKYRSPSTSGLTFEVKPGNNTFDVDMQRP
jgi:hypothetical protein